MSKDAPDSARIRFSIASNLGEVRCAADSIRDFLTRSGCAASDISDCELALVEACNNAILYAQPEPQQRVEIEAQCGPHAIELRIIDHTRGFEWPEKSVLPKADSENGRGVFIIQAVMSLTKYERNLAGNTLMLQKVRSNSVAQ